MSILKSPDSATMVGLLTAAGVYLIYNNALPNAADISASAPHNDAAESSRKRAAYISAALVGGVFLIARDLNSYIISGIGLVGIDYMFKHSNAVHPMTGKLDASTSGQSIAPGLDQAYPLADYSDSGDQG